MLLLKFQNIVYVLQLYLDLLIFADEKTGSESSFHKRHSPRESEGTEELHYEEMWKPQDGKPPLNGPYRLPIKNPASTSLSNDIDQELVEPELEYTLNGELKLAFTSHSRKHELRLTERVKQPNLTSIPINLLRVSVEDQLSSKMS